MVEEECTHRYVSVQDDGAPQSAGHRVEVI
jgi:hypothetical protein